MTNALVDAFTACLRPEDVEKICLVTVTVTEMMRERGAIRPFFPPSIPYGIPSQRTGCSRADGEGNLPNGGKFRTYDE